MSQVNDIKRLAILPARGGSKRIKRKNIKDFCGKPIIYYPLLTASKSNLFTEIHVSTEDNEIYEVAKKLGFEPKFKRTKSLATDCAPTLPVLRYVIEEYRLLGKDFDEVWSINPCSPLITETDLINAANLFISKESVNPLLAVSDLPIPINWAYTINEDNLLIPNMPGEFAKRSQDCTKGYYDTGTFAIFTNEMLKESEGAGVQKKFIAYKLPKKYSIDIDDIEDWELAEVIYLGSKIRSSY